MILWLIIVVVVLAGFVNRERELRTLCERLQSDELEPYLERLEETEIIERVWPITEPPTTRRSRYRPRDYFLAFWHRYVLPNRSLIEEGVPVADEIRKEYDNYIGILFEGIARQLVSRLNREGLLPLRYNKAGPWWHKDLEVDLLLVNTRAREAMLVEVKWNRLTGRDLHRIFYKLEQVAQRIPQIWDYRKHYGVIAREIEGRAPSSSGSST